MANTSPKMYSVETATPVDWHSYQYNSIFIPNTTLVRAAQTVLRNAARLGHRGEIWRADGTKIGFPMHKPNLPKDPIDPEEQITALCAANPYM